MLFRSASFHRSDHQVQAACPADSRTIRWFGIGPEPQSGSDQKPAPVSEESKQIIDKVNRKNAARKDVICKDNTSPLSLLFYHDYRKKSVGLGMSVSREYRNTETQKITDNCPDKDAVQFQTTTNNRFKGS